MGTECDLALAHSNFTRIQDTPLLILNVLWHIWQEMQTRSWLGKKWGSCEARRSTTYPCAMLERHYYHRFVCTGVMRPRNTTENIPELGHWLVWSHHQDPHWLPAQLLHGPWVSQLQLYQDQTVLPPLQLVAMSHDHLQALSQRTAVSLPWNSQDLIVIAITYLKSTIKRWNSDCSKTSWESASPQIVIMPMPAKLEMVQLQEGKENHTRHPPEGNAHAHTKLSCRQIHFSNPFSDWMLHLHPQYYKSEIADWALPVRFMLLQLNLCSHHSNPSNKIFYRNEICLLTHPHCDIEYSSPSTWRRGLSSRK